MVGKRPLVAAVQAAGALHGSADDVQQAAKRGTAGPGMALPHGDQIQSLFGARHDVSGVRAHVGGPAAEASAGMGARAYATGSDVAFAEPPSLHLAAHEAAHTVQQRAGVQLAGGVGQAGDAYERHADAVADLVVQGKSVAGLLDTMAGAGGGSTAVQRDVHLPAHVDNTVKPAWTKAEVIQIQRELQRLGLYRLGADGDLGDKTDAGLVEAFGDNAWRTMPAATARARLVAAKPPAGPKGEHALRYGEMFADGLLDITLGIGFDESSLQNHVLLLDALSKALAARAFAVDAALGAKLYQEAGRVLPANPFGTFWVKPDALTYAPPAGAPRNIHAVVRLVASPDGKQGAAAASAFEDGMVESDVALYGGHGRYGSGPDFDRNFTVDLFDAKHQLEASFDDYKLLEDRLAKEGKPRGRTAWEQFEWRVAQNRVAVRGDNGGNVRMTLGNHHPGEFGAKLMYWNLNQKGSGVAPVTGKDSDLAKRARPDRKYRVQMFDGCRTDDYESELRATPGQDKQSTDTFGSTQTLQWSDMADTVAAFLDAVMKMQSAEKIAKALDAAQVTGGNAGKGTVKPFGTDDNPIYK